MRAYLDSQRDWLCAERLPAYALELNPVEYVWANVKDVELANLPTTTLAEVADASIQGRPIPACPSTHEPSTQPTKLNKEVRSFR